ncbi:hypothetical protein BDP27DRAFT_1419053 [Rhodocollybia butyracea]|uniref:Uncharacterized protein n=1 Tax=Rhodocollybia butyracea TaxID=206335 RepID=A0A9P5Q0P5_9AGAR|nr:hypothetical protein BDP27DRAFT_1419053 [Rhodocollybia butyracea]
MNYRSLKTWWNHHRVRSQSAKLMPSGHVPGYAFDHPAEFDGMDCRISIPKEAVTRLRGFLEEDTQLSREECFRWYPDDFSQRALSAWESVGSPKVDLSSAWDVFIQIAPLVTLIL